MLENPLLQNKTRITSNVLGEDILNLLDKTFIMPLTFKYDILKVSKDYIARPDLISKHVYGTDKFQDILCKLNGISNPFELNEGCMLVVPDISEMEQFYYVQDTSDEEPENEERVDVPVAKAVNEKRKPNEAVIGDKRYRIDPTRKVIVY